MNGNSDELVNQGIKAYKAGEKKDARDLFLQAIKLNDRNEKAWLWLSGVIGSVEKRRVCLENVLAIDPENKAAQKGLAQLDARENQPAPEVKQPSTAESSVSQAAESAPAPPRPKTKTTVSKKEKNNTNMILAIGAVVVVILFCCVGIMFVVPNMELDAGNSPEVEPTLNREPIIRALVYENLDAYNVQDVNRYMATIHPEADFYDETQKELEGLLGQYDLKATIDNLEVLEIGDEEARVRMTLTTRKVSGPAFRDNRIDMEMVLRKLDRRWFIYDQTVYDVEYLD